MIASSPEAFAAEDIEWILTQSECWPALLQILCQERLASLEKGETNAAWKERSLSRMSTIKDAWKK
jgi:hypothetical protein